MWIKEKFSREYHVVCNGKTNRPSEKDLLLSDARVDYLCKLSNKTFSEAFNFGFGVAF